MLSSPGAIAFHQNTQTALSDLSKLFNSEFNSNKIALPRVSNTLPIDEPADNTQQDAPKYVHEQVTRNNNPVVNPDHSSPNENTPPPYMDQPNIITQPDEPPPLTRSSPCQHRNTNPPHITQEMNAVTFLMDNQYPHSINSDFARTPVCNAVVHPVTKETITKYVRLAMDSVTSKIWRRAFCLKLGRLAQG